MTKKEYLKPTILVFETDMKQLILAGSVKSVSTEGLDGDNLTKSDTSGDSWSGAMSRRHGFWDED